MVLSIILRKLPSHHREISIVSREPGQRKPVYEISNRSDTNQHAQLQKLAICLKNQIKKSRAVILSRQIKTKALNCLRYRRAMFLCLWFFLYAKAGFLMMWLISLHLTLHGFCQLFFFVFVSFRFCLTSS